MNNQEFLFYSIDKIIKALRSRKFNLTSEKTTQQEIAEAFLYYAVSFYREHRLDDKNIVDFWCAPGIVVEVKLKAPKSAIYKQCVRYCNFPEVKGLILVTNTSMGFPGSINGKISCIYHLGRAWL